MSSDSAIVLAMHGVPPSDFPRRELDEFFGLHVRFEHGEGHKGPVYERYVELERKMREWPRTEGNDPYHAASLVLARELGRVMDCEVIVGFNEFCAPGLAEAIDRAAELAGSVLVVTPMMTQGGEHSERDIPSAVTRARERHPGSKIVYAWPFPVADVAAFLAEQLRQFLTPDHP